LDIKLLLLKFYHYSEDVSFEFGFLAQLEDTLVQLHNLVVIFVKNTVFPLKMWQFSLKMR
jgi:hypothetical protein